jgi:hypothetical protein
MTERQLLSQIVTRLERIEAQLQLTSGHELAVRRYEANAPLSVRDVATVLGISPAGVQMAVQRGRLKRTSNSRRGFSVNDVKNYCFERRVKHAKVAPGCAAGADDADGLHVSAPATDSGPERNPDVEVGGRL